MLVTALPRAVGDVHVGEPVGHLVQQRERIGSGDRGVGRVEGEVPVVVVQRAPVRGVRRHLPAAQMQRKHVLHREAETGFLGQPHEPGGEAARVLPLPAKRRMDDDRVRSEPRGGLGRPVQLSPRSGPPYPLGDDQAGGVYGEDRNREPVTQAQQGIDVLAHRVRPHHHLQPVIAGAGRQSESGSHRLRVGGHRRQRHPGAWNPDRLPATAASRCHGLAAGQDDGGREYDENRRHQ